MGISLARRFLLACFALALATLVLHERCADLLVLRGDGELAAGRPDRAHAFYARALWFRPHAQTAAERLTFSDLEDGGVDRLHEAMEISRAALVLDPKNAALWTDRALCASRLGDDRAAEDAYSHAGNITHDSKLLYLSALAAHRLGENVDIHMYESHHAGAGKRA
jgi:tetratricopeptide (TPR) repeat protein